MHATVALIVTSACGTLSKAAVVLESESQHDGLAEWSKALASGASPQGRGFEPHSRHSFGRAPPLGAAPSRWASQVGGPCTSVTMIFASYVKSHSIKIQMSPPPSRCPTNPADRRSGCAMRDGLLLWASACAWACIDLRRPTGRPCMLRRGGGPAGRPWVRTAYGPFE